MKTQIASLTLILTSMPFAYNKMENFVMEYPTTEYPFDMSDTSNIEPNVRYI